MRTFVRFPLSEDVGTVGFALEMLRRQCPAKPIRRLPAFLKYRASSEVSRTPQSTFHYHRPLPGATCYLRRRSVMAVQNLQSLVLRARDRSGEQGSVRRHGRQSGGGPILAGAAIARTASHADRYQTCRKPAQLCAGFIRQTGRSVRKQCWCRRLQHSAHTVKALVAAGRHPPPFSAQPRMLAYRLKPEPNSRWSSGCSRYANAHLSVATLSPVTLLANAPHFCSAPAAAVP
jgi:hypothetical protein